ncbi:MAG: hypothetical protein NTX57_01445, partial [Armatimonadetes bacterium]|nr:hypothetical protein [Armatimonadota bacterium]
ILKVQNIRDLYRGKGLIVIAIHRPMGPYDLDIDSVNQVRDQIGITEKCIFDNDHSIGDSLGVIAWPTYFLFDSECKLRRHAKGQLGIRMIEQSLIRMFSESS